MNESEIKCKKALVLILASKEIKCLEIDLTNKIQKLCFENYKVLLKEIKEELFRSFIHYLIRLCAFLELSFISSL